MQQQTLNITDFGDGLNTKLPASRLKPSEAVLVSNLRTIGGTLYPRKDKVDDGIVVAGSPVHSQAIFETSGERFHLAGVGNDVYVKTLVDSPWWDTAWQYRLANGITITNSSSISEVNYAIWVTLPSDFDYAKAKANGDDIRFIKEGVELPYWIKHWGTSVAGGKENTDLILAVQGVGDGGSYAAKACSEYSTTEGGILYDDWYLPSKDELLELYKNRAAIGGFSQGHFWSSSEASMSVAWSVFFYNGNYANNEAKSNQLSVRPVRMDDTPVTTPLAIGASYKGGKVAYIHPSNKYVLIAAIADLPAVRWSAGSFIVTGATNMSIGIGITSSFIAVKVAIPAQSSFVIDMYVGNALAALRSNKAEMFLVYDNFDTDPFAIPTRMTKETTNTDTNAIHGNSLISNTGAGSDCSAYHNNINLSSGFCSITTRVKTNETSWTTSGEMYFATADTQYQIYYTNAVADSFRICNGPSNILAEQLLPLGGVVLNNTDYIIRVWWENGKITAQLFPIGQPSIATITCIIPTTAFIKIGCCWEWASYGSLVYDQVIASYNLYNPLIVVSNLSILEGQTTLSLWQKAFLPDDITSIFTNPAPWRTVSIRDSSFIEKIVFANGVDTPRTWDGANWVVWGANRGLNKPVKYLAVHKGRLFAANADGGEQSRLYYCNTTSQGLADFDSANSWQTEESTVGGDAVWIDNQEDFLGGGLEITGLIPAMYDSLIVAKSDEITLLYGNSPSDWGKKKLPYPYGIYAPRATVKFEDTLFFVSKIGVHYMSGESGNASAFTFDNIKADSLTEMIQADFLAQNLPSAVGVVWDNKYYIFFPNTLKCFVLDWRRKSWWIDSGEDMVSAIVDNYKNIMYTGSTDGKIYKYENASAVVGTNIWKSGILQPMPNCEVRIREIIVSCKGHVKLTISSEKETPPLSDITVTGGLKHVRVGHNIQGNQFELQLENLTDSVEGVEMMVIPLRRV